MGKANAIENGQYTKEVFEMLQKQGTGVDGLTFTRLPGVLKVTNEAKNHFGSFVGKTIAITNEATGARITGLVVREPADKDHPEEIYLSYNMPQDTSERS